MEEVTKESYYEVHSGENTAVHLDWNEFHTLLLNEPARGIYTAVANFPEVTNKNK